MGGWAPGHVGSDLASGGGRGKNMRAEEEKRKTGKRRKEEEGGGKGKNSSRIFYTTMVHSRTLRRHMHQNIRCVC